MYEYAKYEFNRWISTLDESQLNPYQKAIINLIVANFDKIASASANGGKRSKVLCDLIEKLNLQTANNLTHKSDVDVSNQFVERLQSLHVERFRGFGMEVDFSFSKQYTFFQGPNGSGKTSLCEALEYSMLGTLEEASARKIPVKKYILHAGETAVKRPVLQCRYKDGKIKQIKPSLPLYRFAFIEKNRIESFSHMGATTAKNQNDRISTLFGLSEFHEFVDDFSLQLGKYLKTESSISEDYDSLKKTIQIKSESIEQFENQKNELMKEVNRIISEIDSDAVSDLESAKKYLTDPETGRLAQLNAKLNQEKEKVIDDQAYLEFCKLINDYLSSIKTIEESRAIILKDVVSSNLTDLYNALIRIQMAWNKDVCPACHTPLHKVVVNPFENAQLDLEKFTRIEKAKNMISKEASCAFRNYRKYAERINLPKFRDVLDTEKELEISDFELSPGDFEVISEKVSKLTDEMMRVQGMIDDETLIKRIKQISLEIINNNKQLSDEIKCIQSISEKLSEMSGQLKEVNRNLTELNNDLESAKSSFNDLEERIKIENKFIEFNKNMISAYENIITRLSVYEKRLPQQMAKDLADKALEYYNTMNEGDADFELLSSLKLPVKENEKILIKMKDGLEQDAMQILSEGHVKLLGLSILLAKAKQMNLPFIIFDDIVNAIDDDHRDGVAKLLIEHEDFADMQMILTCHGDMFISKLEDRVTDSSQYNRYMLLPADTLDQRGVVIEYRDPTIPLEMAKAKFKRNELKDTAMRCRQAIESITGKLWDTIVKNSGGGIQVSIRQLSKSPDLKQIVLALISACKKSKIKGLEDIQTTLTELSANSVWTFLNKGVHVDETTPEFSRSEIKNLLDLTLKLADQTKNLKIEKCNIGMITDSNAVND